MNDGSTSGNITAWAKAKCEEVIKNSRIRADDGSILFTPDGVGHYGALWTRDFAYLVENGSEFLEGSEVRAAIDILFAGQRGDGAIPDRVNRWLVPFFYPGADLGAGPALDNGMFMVSLVYHYHRNFHDGAYVESVLENLRRGLAFVPRNRGLVFNDAQKPSCSYGFQDIVAKSGHDLFCSLLLVEAFRQMAEMDAANADEWRSAAQATEDALEFLWDENHGAYRAASESCRQIDIWGNAFLVAKRIGPASRRLQVASYLESKYPEYVYCGQVRHLLVPDQWEKLFEPRTVGTYQNGGYWGTPSGWLIEALESVNRELSERTLVDLVEFYRANGILEWVSPDGGNGPDLYVASILNFWSILKRSDISGR